jgi:hypothetical protein
MKSFGWALAALATLAPVSVSAQVRAGASAAEAGMTSAAALSAPVPAGPLRFEATLNPSAPTLGAGVEFLGDASAQSWYAVNRPSQLPTVMHAALQLHDWEQLLASPGDPRILREGILSRRGDALAEPARLLSLVDRTPALAADREKYANAVLDWSVLDPRARAAMEQAGYTERRWDAQDLHARCVFLRAVYADLERKMTTLSPEDPGSVGQRKEALRLFGSLLTDAEMLERSDAIARAERAAQRAARAAEATASALLNDDRAGSASGPRPDDRLSAAEIAELQRRLVPAVLASLEGTAIGAQLRTSLSGTGLNLAVDDLKGPVIAHYERAGKRVVFNALRLREMLAELRRTPRDLLTDDEALADAVVLYSHVFVHEATHHGQYHWADRHLPPEALPFAYSRQWEIEAVLAQAAFLRQKRASDPDFAAREARLLARKGTIRHILTSAEAIAGDAGRMKEWLAARYAATLTLSGSGARMIGRGIAADRDGSSRGGARTMMKAFGALCARSRAEIERLSRRSEPRE